MANKETYKERMAYLISKGHDWYEHKADLLPKEKEEKENKKDE